MFEQLAGRTPAYLGAGQARRYAVAALFLPQEEAFLFEVRSAALRRQPGEISFPGGEIEPGEAPAAAALRETCEELLVDAGAVRLVAPLDIYFEPYSIEVTPYLATLEGYEGTFQRDEVQEVFTVPFRFFLDTEPEVYYNRTSMTPEPGFPYGWIGGEDYPWRTARYPVLFYRYGGRVIWGMTARFIHNAVTLYRGL